MYLYIHILLCPLTSSFFFFFNDTATTEIYTLSLHDALPIFPNGHDCRNRSFRILAPIVPNPAPSSVITGKTISAPRSRPDRKSTRLNSSHSQISYAVFCLKKKKKNKISFACE